MPWHKVQNHDECTTDQPWAVVSDDGVVQGLHATEVDADDMISAEAAKTLEEVTNPESTSEVEPDAVVAALAVVEDDVTATDDGPDVVRMLDGSVWSRDQFDTESAWSGVIVVEGQPTGDGREFSPEALDWVESNALLRWQKEGAHGGMNDRTVSVGRIDRMWRENEKIFGEGVIDLLNPDGFELYRRMKDNFAGGISIDADDINDADIEFVWPEGEDDDDGIMMLFRAPEKVIYHGGRIRAATVVDIPAFVEAVISLNVNQSTEVVASPTVDHLSIARPHVTAVSDNAWFGAVEAKRLPLIMTVDRILESHAWVNMNAVRNGRASKADGWFLHHEINADGSVGPANVTACAKGIAQLSGGRNATLIRSRDEARAVYDHLAAHIRAAGQEPPPLRWWSDYDSVVASANTELWKPPAEWFTNPRLQGYTGITVTDEGRVYGHAAPWGQCHIGFDDQCITLPEEAEHSYFMTGEVVCDDGSRQAVGQITLGTGHAPLGYRAQRAAEHYDNTGVAVADVAVGNDEFGVWVAGSVRPSVEVSRVHELRASGRVSGDWRRIGGALRLVGLLAVNVPGFPIPATHARVASGAPVALVAAGAATSGRFAAPTTEDLDQAAFRRVMDVLAKRVHKVED